MTVRYEFDRIFRTGFYDGIIERDEVSFVSDKDANDWLNYTRDNESLDFVVVNFRKIS
jgi:hypothetical protein